MQESCRLPERLYPLANAEQAIALLWAALWQAAAIIFQHQLQPLAAGLGANGDRVGIGMFDHVVEPLLTDPKQGDPLGIGEIPIRQLPLQPGNDAVALQLQLSEQCPHRLLQGHVVELARTQAT